MPKPCWIISRRWPNRGCPSSFWNPTDLSAITDDYDSLLPNDPRVALVASPLPQLRGVCGRTGGRREAKPKLYRTEKRHLILHGHCHQKALIGTKPAHRALTLPPNYTLEEVDSSCCGMASSFGYEAEHVDISLKMAERRLLPAMRAAAPTILVSPASAAASKSTPRRSPGAASGGSFADRPQVAAVSYRVAKSAGEKRLHATKKRA